MANNLVENIVGRCCARFYPHRITELGFDHIEGRFHFSTRPFERCGLIQSPRCFDLVGKAAAPPLSARGVLQNSNGDFS